VLGGDGRGVVGAGVVDHDDLGGARERREGAPEAVGLVDRQHQSRDPQVLARVGDARRSVAAHRTTSS
jgi:hypothetical protein